jgi:hypothetical protein
MMETIRVPKPAPEAFHKHRRVSDLLMSQVAHFQHVAERKSLRIDPEMARDVHTEGGAARFIAAVTRALHEGAARGKGKVVPIERGRWAASADAGGTVRRIAAKAETPKKTKTESGTASRLKKTAKKAVKTSAKGGVKTSARKAVKKSGAAAARTSTASRKSSTGGKPRAAHASAKTKTKAKQRKKS